MANYPVIGFHFKVEFEFWPGKEIDSQFQEVTGLNAEVLMDTFNEGGENRFVHRLPGRTKYADLVLKRGMAINSDIAAWCKDAIENFNYQPVNLNICLLDEEHNIVCNWYVVNAIPMKWDISTFNAEEGKLVVETLTLRYEYFQNKSVTGNAPTTLERILNSLESDVIGVV